MKDQLHFKGLSGLRALAALAVVVSHINLNLPHFALPKMGALALANFGVTIFFALSGFLITYLLLHEKHQTHVVDIKRFYFRRILRIWPLYFLYIALVVIYADIKLKDERLLYYFLFVPNVSFVIGQSVPLLTHYWSLGVEEQFYILWPGLVKFTKRLFTILVIFVFAFIGLKVLVKFTAPPSWYAFLHYSRFGCMAIGGLAAWLYYFQPEKLSILKNAFVQVLAWACLALVMFNKFHLFSIIDHEIVAVVTVVIIINQITSSSVINLENPVLNYLGKISFGLYVFNPLIIALFENLLRDVDTGWIGWRYVIVYTIIPLAVIGVSHVSFVYFEKIFLRLKDKFAVVPSTG